MTPAEAARAMVEDFGAALEFAEHRDDLISRLAPVFARAQAVDDSEAYAYYEHAKRQVVQLRERAEVAEMRAARAEAELRGAGEEIEYQAKLRKAAEAQCDATETDVQWLREVLRRIATGPRIPLTTQQLREIAREALAATQGKS